MAKETTRESMQNDNSMLEMVLATFKSRNIRARTIDSQEPQSVAALEIDARETLALIDAGSQAKNLGECYLSIADNLDNRGYCARIQPVDSYADKLTIIRK